MTSPDMTTTPTVSVPAIWLTAAEIQSGFDRQLWAEGLILQLPASHDGRNSWLLNHGVSDAAQEARLKMGLEWNEKSRAINPPVAPALTPRHEAPACPHDAYETDSAGQPVRCSDCHEAPAEGAGERVSRLSDALIRMIEHFERVDAPEADKAVIQYASKTWASVKDESARPAPEASPQVEAVAWRFRDHPENGWVYTGLGGRHDGCEVQPLYTHPQPAQTPGVGAWVVRSPNGNVRYWSRDEALTKRNAAKWGLEARHEALGPSPFRPSEGEVGDALSEASKRIPDTILHGNSFGHEGFYPHAAIKTLVAAVYAGLSSAALTATQPDRGVEGENLHRLAAQEAVHLEREAEEADDNNWQDWAVTMRQAADYIRQLIRARAKPADGGLREALERIADEAPYRSGYCQSDVAYAPTLTAEEMQAVARAALEAGESA